MVENVPVGLEKQTKMRKVLNNVDDNNKNDDRQISIRKLSSVLGLNELKANKLTKNYLKRNKMKQQYICKNILKDSINEMIK